MTENNFEATNKKKSNSTLKIIDILRGKKHPQKNLEQPDNSDKYYLEKSTGDCNLIAKEFLEPHEHKEYCKATKILEESGKSLFDPKEIELFKDKKFKKKSPVAIPLDKHKVISAEEDFNMRLPYAQQVLSETQLKTYIQLYKEKIDCLKGKINFNQQQHLNNLESLIDDSLNYEEDVKMRLPYAQNVLSQEQLRTYMEYSREKIASLQTKKEFNSLKSLKLNALESIIDSFSLYDVDYKMRLPHARQILSERQLQTYIQFSQEKIAALKSGAKFNQFKLLRLNYLESLIDNYMQHTTLCPL